MTHIHKTLPSPPRAVVTDVVCSDQTQPNAKDGVSTFRKQRAIASGAWRCIIRRYGWGICQPAAALYYTGIRFYRSAFYTRHVSLWETFAYPFQVSHMGYAIEGLSSSTLNMCDVF
ncbi:hypothetical protein Bbelb_014080 [Branchiostoma belcheri]|nr:hypothetical protein Bbelb_014080 [Branchiostoma belcheri]